MADLNILEMASLSILLIQIEQGVMSMCISEDRDCDNCKHSYEDETLDGYWQLYCIKKLDNKEGSAVFPYDCCDKFESKQLKTNF